MSTTETPSHTHDWLEARFRPKSKGVQSPPLLSAVWRLKQELGKRLAKKKKDEDDRGEWLKTLYAEHSGRAKSSDDRIWTITGIVLPLIAAAIPAYLTIDHPKCSHAIVFGVFSVALAPYWAAAAENHRSYSLKGQAWMIAIQETAGFVDPLEDKLQDDCWFNERVTGRDALRRMRCYVVFAIAVTWLAIIFSQCLCPLRQLLHLITLMCKAAR